jgi:Amidohydrolase
MTCSWFPSMTTSSRSHPSGRTGRRGRFAEQCPRIVETDGDMIAPDGRRIAAGSQIWTYEGHAHPSLGLNAVAGRPSSDLLGFDPIRFDEMLPGCYDAAERVKDMDLDGVAVQTCFPNFPRFAGARFQDSKDPELGIWCIQAWNDYVLDEWCAAAPGRFIPLVMIPYWDVPAAVAEIERTADARVVLRPVARPRQRTEPEDVQVERTGSGQVIDWHPDVLHAEVGNRVCHGAPPPGPASWLLPTRGARTRPPDDMPGHMLYRRPGSRCCTVGLVLVALELAFSRSSAG